MNSKAFQINWQDLLKLSKNALFVGGAASLVYFAQNLHLVDLGAVAVLFVPVITTGIDALVTWLKDNSK